MHLLVLSAFRHRPTRTHHYSFRSLNAPFGAQCFPTRKRRNEVNVTRVSMHLLVLSAFRPNDSAPPALDYESQYTFWCSVLSDRSDSSSALTVLMSQCTFWCSVLSDPVRVNRRAHRRGVSMHLLVLSAFRLDDRLPPPARRRASLNAPFGAQCFPTHMAVAWIT